ncbi:hypothetical protein M3Y98_00869700 [Aphelenchoides besseyi]|nr:hypothetical protein M3Y98_00869700 [Aphelenchoides besseyi]KAI6211270.1 hypothetical protein M3Y96_00415800 [Aphelenchoides besseyi]
MAPDADFENTMSPKHYDPVTFDVLRVNCEDIAKQITRNDLEVFKRISVSELLSCAWSTKRKMEEAPNIVEFTRRFNSTGHLARREILNGRTPERRAQLITYFIKLAKKLYQLNNLHSTWALISALNTQAIFRLELTWEKVSKHDRHSMERMAELFSERDNFRALRLYMENAAMPCIPHLGLYLTDMVFMNDMLKKTNNPADRIGIQENINKMLRSLCSFQDSVYDELPYRPHIQSYLKSGEIEIGHSAAADAERALYDLSLRYEPPNSSTMCLATVDGLENGSNSQSPRRSSLPLQAIRDFTTTPVHQFATKSESSTTPRKKSHSGFLPSSTLATKWRRGKHGQKSMGIENASFADSPVDPRCQTADFGADSSPPSSAKNTISSWQLTPRRDPTTTWYDEQIANSTTTDDSSLDERDLSYGRFHRSASTAAAGALISELWKKMRIGEMADGAARKFRSPRHAKSGTPSPTGQFSYSASSTPVNRRRFFGTWTPTHRRESSGTIHGQPIDEDESDDEAADNSTNQRRNVAIVDNRPLLAENVEADLFGVFTRTQLRGIKSKSKLLRTHHCVYIELRGSLLLEFERRTIPLHAADERALFQRHPKRIIDLRAQDIETNEQSNGHCEGPRWQIQRPSEDHRPGFELLDTKTGRVFHYACRTWTVACHWLKTLSECVNDEQEMYNLNDDVESTIRTDPTTRRRLTAAVEAQDRGFESTRL